MTSTGAPSPPTPGRAIRTLVRNVGGLARDTLLLPLESRVRRDWLVVRLDRGVSEVPGPGPWLDELLRTPRPLSDVVAALTRAADDPSLRGVLVRVGGRGPGWSTVSAITALLGRLRAAGRRVVVHAERTGNAGAWMGATADLFWMSPGGRLDLLGLRGETPFVGPALERLGIRPEVFQVGRYKSIGEILTRDSMSDDGRRALEGVIDGLYASLIEGLASGRAGSEETARRWIDEGPYVAEEAQEAGIVDDLVYGDEIPARLAALDEGTGKTGGDREARLLGERVYARVTRRRFLWRPILAGPDRVVVVPLVGMIGPGSGSPRGLVGVLRALEEDDSVAAVVVRISSPGGDPLASDLIRHAVSRVARRKPVVASLGDVAASGGYYVAIGAPTIVAERTTLTGSIGVVMASVDLGALLERVGVRFDGVQRGAHAGIYHPTRPRTDEERALLARHAERIYRDFVRKVAESRGLEISRVEELAEGRVWTGAQALDLGLVDEIGGLDRATARAREAAGVAPDGPEPEYVRGAAPGVRRLLRSGPLALGGQLPAGAQLLCPFRIPLG